MGLAQSPPTITTYATPTAYGSPFGIVTGPDGALWFTEQAGNKIGQITTAGVVTEFTVPTAASGPAGITAGPDGALWFTEGSTNKIGRITTAGVFTEYTIPTAASGPAGIVTGPDGNLWFTEFSANKIGQITTAGVFTEWATPTANSAPHGITAGPDGDLWFTEFTANNIGQIATNGAITEFPTPTANSQPSWIAAGPDGALWFTEALTNKIGRITTAGAIIEYPVPTANSKPEGITVGPDGALWFTEYAANQIGQIGRITTSGAVKEYQSPTPYLGGYPYNITLGPDGALWFTYEFGNDIGRVAPAPGPAISGTSLPSGAIGAPYTATLSASGGVPPYSNWTVTSGSLPQGLALAASTGVISGTPSGTGTSSFSVTVQDSAGSTSAAQSFSITVGQAPCTYALSPGGLSFTSAGGPGSIAITASASNCAWSVTGLPSWVTLTSAASGAGNGTVTVQVGINNGNDLSSTFTIAGITFAIQQQSASIPGLSFIGSMPHLAAEGGWNTTFTFVNKGATSAIARNSLFAPGGGPLTLPIDLPQQSSNTLASSLDQTIAPNASFVMEATGPANVAYLEGSAQLAATGDVDGFAIFHFDPSGQEAAVPMETRNANSYLLAFDNTNSVLTGVAIANVSTSSASIPVIIRNDAGTPIETESLTLAANGHTSFVLSTLYPMTANIRGTVEFEAPSGSQISVLGIRFTPPGTLTTIPSLGNVGTGGGLLAHLASGAGWQTTFVLVNTGASAAQATLNFFDDNGAQLPLPLTFTQTGATSTASSVTQSIPANASLWVQSAGTGALLTGSAQLTTTGNISGFVIFRYNPNGQEAVVPLETRNASAYLLAFDNTGGTATGVAISDVSSQAASIAVVIRDDTGTQRGTSGIALPLNGHTSFILSQQFPETANLRGTIEFDAPASAQISVVGIRSPPALTFTTLPPLAK